MSAFPAQLITKEQDEEFSYAQVKKEYTTKCSNYFSNCKRIDGPWTLQLRKECIEYLKDNTKVMSFGLNLDIKALLPQCQVALDGGEEKIIFADTAIELLPYEECLGIFVDLHRKSNHGLFGAMKALMENKFYVKDECITFFIESCNVCKKYRKNYTPTVFNDRAIIEIIEAPVKDQSCSFILYYKDMATQYKLLKPLISMDETEISIELLKIFTDFGPPLGIQTMHTDLIKNVLTKLAEAGLKYTVSLYQSAKAIVEQVIKPDHPDIDNWAAACRFSQFTHNNVTFKGHRPYDLVFNFRKKDYIRTNKATKTNVDNTPTDSNNKPETEYVMSSDEEKIKEMDTENRTTNNDLLVIQQFQNGVIIKDDLVVGERQHEIKNEYEPEKMNEDGDEENTIDTPSDDPLIVEDEKYSLMCDITIKEEITIEETSIVRPSVSKVNESRTEPEPLYESSQTVVDVASTSNPSKESGIPEGMDTNKRCASCGHAMLTDYFCFDCKKLNHIFCLTRVTTQVVMGEPIVSFTYCRTCLDKSIKL